MNFLQLTIARFKSKSPSYFQKLQSFGMWLAGSAGAGFGALKIVPDNLPSWVSLALSYSFVAGAFLAGTAKLTTTDPNLQQDVVNKPDSEATNG